MVMAHIDEEVNNVAPTGTTWRFSILKHRHEAIAQSEHLGDFSTHFIYEDGEKNKPLRPTTMSTRHNPSTMLNKRKSVALSVMSGSVSSDTLVEIRSRSASAGTGVRIGVGSLKMQAFKPRFEGLPVDLLPSA